MTIARQGSHREEEPVPPPTGTMFVMIAYLALMAGMWAWMFLRLVQR